jgi:hypothetical protein
LYTLFIWNNLREKFLFIAYVKIFLSNYRHLAYDTSFFLMSNTSRFLKWRSLLTLHVPSVSTDQQGINIPSTALFLLNSSCNQKSDTMSCLIHLRDKKIIPCLALKTSILYMGYYIILRLLYFMYRWCVF